MKRMKKWIVVLLAMIMLCTPVMDVAAANASYPAVDMFEKATTIKGMQGAKDSTKYSYGEFQHSLINIYLDDCIFSPDSAWAQNGWVAPYTFEGETFYFGDCPPGIGFIENCNNCDMSISVVFLLRMKTDEYNNDSTFLIDPASRVGGYNYYAPNTDLSTYGGRAIRAYWHFLMEWLCNNGYHIDNFILGNEVNMVNSWHYSGTTDPTTVATKYADAFYTMYSTVRKYTDVSRCSVSVDHSWNHNNNGNGVGVRDYLYLFNNRLQQYGVDVDWCISMHLYPALLYNTRIWDRPYGLATNSVDTQMVDGTNLSFVTNYIRDTYGEEHRIMLTEQGFGGDYGADVQAACLAYTYYAAMYDPMVDSFLISMEDAADGYYEGSLKYMNFNLAGTLAGEVYTKIGNGNATDEQWIANVCLPVIGVSSWTDIVPNYGQPVDKANQTYSGDINGDLRSLELKQYTNGVHYLSGEIAVTEVVDGVSGEPREKPVLAFMSADGVEYTPLVLILTDAGTYHFEHVIGTLPAGKEYVLRLESASAKNISPYRLENVNLLTSPNMPSTKELGRIGDHRIAYYQLDDGVMRIYGKDLVEKAVLRKKYH